MCTLSYGVDTLSHGPQSFPHFCIPLAIKSIGFGLAFVFVFASHRSLQFVRPKMDLALPNSNPHSLCFNPCIFQPPFVGFSIFERLFCPRILEASDAFRPKVHRKSLKSLRHTSSLFLRRRRRKAWKRRESPLEFVEFTIPIVCFNAYIFQPKS